MRGTGKTNIDFSFLALLGWIFSSYLQGINESTVAIVVMGAMLMAWSLG